MPLCHTVKCDFLWIHQMSFHPLTFQGQSAENFKIKCCLFLQVSMLFRIVRESNHPPSTHSNFRAFERRPLTGKPSKHPSYFSILSHPKFTGHTTTFDDFRILSSCSGSQDLLIHESLLLNKMKPSLNVQRKSIVLQLL